MYEKHFEFYKKNTYYFYEKRIVRR